MEAAHSRTGSLAVRRQLTALRKQLRSLYGDRMEYALLRTKQKFYTGGDKAGCLLVPHLGMQTASRRVVEVHLPDGTLTCQEALILQQFERIYLDFAEGLDSQDIEDYLDSTPLSQIPPQTVPFWRRTLLLRRYYRLYTICKPVKRWERMALE
ncbi:hypothetical protein NDU88_008718 [Pleurodeles waltl]|uniref:Uncharacterized protein n=1 Tax=Pleurodeles waltl TaxID=8319 RepID=A0AAV7PQL9_PLEWA|nr:hypothetical protein NDU88_008718 [Pleurodeles waltl]